MEPLVTSFFLREGDYVIHVSDGVSDNLPEDLSGLLGEENSASAVRDALVRHVQAEVSEKHGKPDHVACVVYQVGQAS